MRILIVPLLVGTLVACSGDVPPLVASDVIITTPKPGTSMSAGYLTLTNTTDAAIVITDVASPDFESVEMHESVIEDGIARMRALDQLAIPAHGTTVLERGAKHLMLADPVGQLDAVTLHFFAGDAPLLSVTTVAGD